MLVITATVKAACPQGTNLSEQIQDGWHKVVKVTGETKEPTFVFRWLEGAPFSGLGSVIAPVALKKRDVIMLDAETGNVRRVSRENEEDTGYNVIFDVTEKSDTQKAPTRK